MSVETQAFLLCVRVLFALINDPAQLPLLLHGDQTSDVKYNDQLLFAGSNVVKAISSRC